jgi:hypothetical protein
MRNMLLAACLVSFSVSAMASCDDVKSQIDAKLQAKGITSYTLEIIPVAQTSAAPAVSSGVAAAPAKGPDGKVVGNCEGESKQIVYKRN